MSDLSQSSSVGNRLTPYGPGKFYSWVVCAAYEASLDGSDAECGDVDECGEHYCLVRGAIHPDDADMQTRAHLSEYDRAFLREHAAGVILREDGQGFVGADFYADATRLDKAWAIASKRIYDCESDAAGEP